MCTLVADGLGKRFSRRVLFRQLSFTLRGGSALAVTGPNGSGKSTLLKILAGLLRPTKGVVTLHVGGRALSPDIRRLHAGLVAPDVNVYEDLTARENLAFLASARNLPGHEGRIRSVLGQVGLSARADDFVHRFSTGMKQRVKLAAALMAEPPLLLLDEPNVNLDADGRALVRRITERHRESGGILVLATNVAEEAEALPEVLRIDEYA